MMKIESTLYSGILVLISLLTACSMVRAPTQEELALLENPPIHIRAKQDRLTPLALEWLNETETNLHKTGQPLSEADVAMARAVGVQQPERVRVIILAEFPVPENDDLLTEASKYGLGSEAEGGRTMGYVILLKKKYSNERWILAHELVHVAQQEQIGKEAFIRRFIAERELMGYGRAPLELEANKLAFDFMW